MCVSSFDASTFTWSRRSFAEHTLSACCWMICEYFFSYAAQRRNAFTGSVVPVELRLTCASLMLCLYDVDTRNMRRTQQLESNSNEATLSGKISGYQGFRWFVSCQLTWVIFNHPDVITVQWESRRDADVCPAIGTSLIENSPKQYQNLFCRLTNAFHEISD